MADTDSTTPVASRHGQSGDEQSGARAVSQDESPSSERNHGKACGDPSGSASPKAEKTSFMKRLRTKLDLDMGTIFLMMKATLPPAISLAILQNDSVAETFTSLGYLVAIISILGFCILPRAKFLQTMLMNIIITCLGSAVALLMNWSAIQARRHTTPAGSPPSPYNSSQSVVLAIWLFFNIYLINSLKAKFPQFTFPTILYAIFINVAGTFGTQFVHTQQAEQFVRRLLEVFLAGFAIASGVSLFIFPVTSRKVVRKEIVGFVGLLRKLLQAHKSYVYSLEESEVFADSSADVADSDLQKAPTAEGAAIKQISASITELHGKLSGDMSFAKREVAFGYLSPEDYSNVAKHLRAIMIPLLGLSAIVDIFTRFPEVNRWYNEGEPEERSSALLREKLDRDWNAISRMVQERFSQIIQVLDQGLEHSLIKLRLAKDPRKATSTPDVEAEGELPRPGDSNFYEYLRDQTDLFHRGKETTLRQWCARHGLEVSDGFFDYQSDVDATPNLTRQKTIAHRLVQGQLYVLLYMEFLLHEIACAILEFVQYTDQLEAQGKFARKRIILPGKRRMRKWILGVFQPDNGADEEAREVTGLNGNGVIIDLGEAFKSRKDPEHLPPTNLWERTGNILRATTRFLRSPESAFGFRCACATMSIAIMGYLHDTQLFFIKQRLIWALIMVAISMTPTTGQSIFSFLLRIVGTTVAMVVAFLVWYIPAEKSPGVIVLLWFFGAILFYIPIKLPRFTIVGVITVVTTTLIVGYELEVRKIGKETAASNGQPYYPIYLLGPYRLATVAAGLAVAFIWTFFPYPINEHSALRQTLGAALYLSANYYSVIHETVLARIRGDEGNPEDKTTPGYRLAKVRSKVFSKQMVVLQALRTHSNFVRWEVPLGGKFPQQDYDMIINCVTNITRYTAVLGYASVAFTNSNPDDCDAQWIRDFRKVVTSVNVTSHEITSFLSLLSSSITTGQPLPPYLKQPQWYQLTRKLEAVDHDILSVRHIAESGYAAFAVMQIATRCINSDIGKLLRTVKKLVGELDFSFHIVSTQDDSASASTSTLFNAQSRQSRNKQD